MIYQMKDQSIDAVENAQDEPGCVSFETLFAEHWAHVYRVLYRMVGDPVEAEDLALETFFRLYQHNPSTGAEFNHGGWLHRVAVNLGLHSIRSLRRRERYELAAGNNFIDEAPDGRPAELLAQEEERNLVRLALSRMNKRQAQLLSMRYSGMSYRDIAESLNLSPTSIGPLLLRAEREFEKRYQALVKE